MSNAQLVEKERRIIGLTEACEYIGVGKGTMYSYIEKGLIPAFKTQGSRVWRFDKQDLERWIEEQKQRGSNV